MDRQQLLVLVLAMLVAVACTKGGEAIADVVAEQLSAEQVLFDDTQAGLGASDVQAAIEAVAAAVNARDNAMSTLNARIASLEATINDLETRLSTSETALGEAKNALNALETAVATTNTDLNVVKAQTTALASIEVQWACPEGTILANDTCVDLIPQPEPKTFDTARNTCKGDGKRLCRVAELDQGCFNAGIAPFEPNNPEWTEDLMSPSEAAILSYDSGCGSNISELSAGTDPDTAHFRCCAPRQAILVVPEPAE